MSEKKEANEAAKFATDAMKQVMDSFERAFGTSYIKLDDAVEVLAKALYERDNVLIGLSGLEYRTWEHAPLKERDEYRDAARKELGK